MNATLSFPVTAWLWWIGGGLLALFGMGLLYWSLLRDRSRRRRRCPRCWYDMSGTASLGILTCSECGKVVKRERRLFKTRRRWRWTMLAVVILLVGIAGVEWPRIKRDGWICMVPSTALILLRTQIQTPITITGSSRAGAFTYVTNGFEYELIRRLKRDAGSDPKLCGLFAWQWRILIRQSKSQPFALKSGWKTIWFQDTGLSDRILAHSLFVGEAQELGAIASLAELTLTDLALSGGPVTRQSKDVTEWVMKKPLTGKSIDILRIRAVPHDPPPGSLGVWLPREMILDAQSGQAGVVTQTWAVQQQCPTGTYQVDFDLYLGGFDGFGGNVTGNQWVLAGSMSGVLKNE